jgi:hypothetical protein
MKTRENYITGSFIIRTPPQIVCGMHEEMRNAHIILVGRCERKRPYGTSRHRYEDSIKMDFKEVRCENAAQNRDQWRALVNTAMNLRVP